MSIVISVTAGHIAEGRPGNCSECPIALAVIAAFPDIEVIEVKADQVTESAWIKAWPSWSAAFVNIPLPHEAYEFIRAFDDSGAVEPLSFTVDYPAVTS